MAWTLPKEWLGCWLCAGMLWAALRVEPEWLFIRAEKVLGVKTCQQGKARLQRQKPNCSLPAESCWESPFSTGGLWGRGARPLSRAPVYKGPVPAGLCLSLPAAGAQPWPPRSALPCPVFVPTGPWIRGGMKRGGGRDPHLVLLGVGLQALLFPGRLQGLTPARSRGSAPKGTRAAAAAAIWVGVMGLPCTKRKKMPNFPPCPSAAPPPLFSIPTEEFNFK